MNLLQTRKKFREVSGRFDLVNEDGSDNGADFFLNEGRKFLDRMDETSKSWGSCFRIVEIGDYSASIIHCRAIKEVWAATSTARWQLEKVKLQDLITEYLTEMPGERNTGAPIYFAPTITRNIPDGVAAEDFESFIGWVEVPSGNTEAYNTILLSVPVEEKLIVEVKGLFYSPELASNTDQNFWTVNHPMLLIMSAMRQAEIVNRNTQGVNDWSNAISAEMTQIGFDLVEEHIAEADQMEN